MDEDGEHLKTWYGLWRADIPDTKVLLFPALPLPSPLSLSFFLHAMMPACRGGFSTATGGQLCFCFFGRGVTRGGLRDRKRMAESDRDGERQREDETETETAFDVA
eukprot:2899913-Rhodomonas_salina.2